MIRRFAVRLLLLAACLMAVAGDASAQGALAFRDASGRFMLFDAISLDLIDGLPTGGEVRDVAVSPDGRYVYVASRARTRASIDSTGSSILVFDLWRPFSISALSRPRKGYGSIAGAPDSGCPPKRMGPFSSSTRRTASSS
jgi:DNA-binding beta-propeller fold protein YncE